MAVRVTIHKGFDAAYPWKTMGAAEPGKAGRHTTWHRLRMAGSRRAGGGEGPPRRWAWRPALWCGARRTTWSLTSGWTRGTG